MEQEFKAAELRDVYIKQPSGEFFHDESHNAVWNLHDNEIACIASEGYKIMQHETLNRLSLEALQNLGVPFKAGAQQYKHRLYIDVEFQNQNIKLEKLGEEFMCGLKIINSYDKTTGILVLPKVKRLACMNGMVVTRIVGGISVRHNSQEVLDYQATFEKMLNKLISANALLNRYVSECMADSVEWNLLEQILPKLIMSEKHRNEIKSRLPEGIISRWDLYNAITNYATHGEQLKPTVEMNLQNIAQKVLEKPLELPAIRAP